MTEALRPDELAAIAVFPLPKLVLFPGARLPLHVFEQRYRDMLADCISGHMCMAVAQLGAGWETEYSGRPSIHTVAGAGRITACRHNRDGTYDIQIHALCRVRLSELPPEEHAYRRAEALVLKDRIPNQGIDPADISALRSLATQVSALLGRTDPHFELAAFVEDNPAAMVDQIADQLIPDPDARQDILETLDVAARLRTTTNKIAQLHLALLPDASGKGHTLN